MSVQCVQLASSEFTISENPKIHFLYACTTGDTHQLSQCIDGIDDLAATTDENGFNGLHLACMNGHVKVAEFLLQKGIDIDYPTSNVLKETSLHIAIRCKKQELVQLLLKNDADVTKNCALNGGDALRLAIEVEEPKIVRMLLEKGVDPFFISKAYPQSAFELVCERQMRPIVFLMLEHFSTEHKRSYAPQIIQSLLLLLPNPDSMASQCKCRRAGQALNTMLVKHNEYFKETLKRHELILPNLHNRNSVFCMQLAVIYDDFLVFQHLMSLHNEPLKDAKNALSYCELAIWFESTEILKVLLQHNPQAATEISVVIKPFSLQTIGFFTSADVVKVLTEHSNLRVAEPAFRDQNLNAIGLAIMLRDYQLLTFLLQDGQDCSFVAGADLAHSMPAIHYAVLRNDVMALSIILQFTSKLLPSLESPMIRLLCKKDPQGRTPLNIALISEHHNAVGFLLARIPLKQLEVDDANLLAQYYLKNDLVSKLEEAILSRQLKCSRNSLLNAVISAKNISALRSLMKYIDFSKATSSWKILELCQDSPEMFAYLIQIQKIRPFLNASELIYCFMVFCSNLKLECCKKMLEIESIAKFVSSAEITKYYQKLFSNMSLDLLLLLLEHGFRVDQADRNGKETIEYAFETSLEITAFILSVGVILKRQANGTAGLYTVLPKSELFFDDNTHLDELDVLINKPVALNAFLGEFNKEIANQPADPMTHLSEMLRKEQREWFAFLSHTPSKEYVKSWLDEHPNARHYLNRYFWVTGWTTIHYVIHLKRIDLIPLLIERGVDPLRQTQITKQTAMHLAVRVDDVEAVTYLAKFQPLYWIKNIDSEGAYDVAIKEHHYKLNGVFDILLRLRKFRPRGQSFGKGTQTESLSNLSDLTRVIWCDYELYVLQDYLSQSKYKALVNQRLSCREYNPLEVAVVRKREQHVRCLLVSGADYKALVPNCRHNVFHLLCSSVYSDTEDCNKVWSVLIEHIPAPIVMKMLSQKDAKGKNPIELAQHLQVTLLTELFQQFVAPKVTEPSVTYSKIEEPGYVELDQIR
ncbi:ankyrin repeat domain-containing protein [Parashewanella curva]|uniref:Ankyrin repeat domain-containing protein n=1 Tax=Parashewanella curva TaxID=2338552 RepID=A0A3L8Q1K6_9GAMM|nr:ankyrin repeat domain-containing protein [Parashewanella curva]RLV60613.1 ankyrin repeat domain-containing protein [Parashewanella curva]